MNWKLIAAALIAGPLFTWLAWAIIRKRWIHAAMAGIANAALYLGGPVLIARALELYQ